MEKLIKCATSFMLAVAFTTVVDGIYQESQSAGVVYTIPADYEKMKKAVEGLIGKKTNEVSLSQAQNAGTNVRQFVESASEMEGYIRSSNHNAFKYAGRNYVNTMEQMTGVDINSQNTNAYGGSGNAVKNAYYYYGQNVRNFMEGVTGKSVYQDNANAYSNAGKNIKSFMEGIGGSSYPITGSYATNYKTAGENLRKTVSYFAYGEENKAITKSEVFTKVKNFKLRADQTFYDTYLNDKALKKSFKFASNFDPTKYKAGLTTITEKNEVEMEGGEGKLDDTFTVSFDFSIETIFDEDDIDKAYILITDAKGETHKYCVFDKFLRSNKKPLSFKDSFGHSWKVEFANDVTNINNHIRCAIYNLYRDGSFVGTANACFRFDEDEHLYNASYFDKASNIKVVGSYY